LCVAGWETDTNVSEKKKNVVPPSSGRSSPRRMREIEEKERKQKDKDNGKGKGFTCYQINMGHTVLFRGVDVTNKKNVKITIY